jgi:hypothetical protein
MWGDGTASIEERRYTELSTAQLVRSASKCDKESRFLHRCGESCGGKEIPAKPLFFIPSFHPL